MVLETNFMISFYVSLNERKTNKYTFINIFSIDT